MIFDVPGHIDMIRNGLYCYSAAEQPIIKTQTRRANRGIYQVGRDYAVQRKRGIKAEGDIRIVIDEIWEEKMFGSSQKLTTPHFLFISKENAHAEGGYIPVDFEFLYKKLNPKWLKTFTRWAFKFHVIEVQK